MNIKNIMKKYSEYLLPILASMLVLGIYLLINKFNIHDSLLINDLESQYIGLMQYWKNVFEGTDSIFYSFSKGLGGNMASTIAYYLTSPLNILVVFFDDVAVAISIGVLLRFCLCNLTAYTLFRKKYQTTKLNTLVFSTIYAFSGFIINYYFNIMWIDILILLPLIILQLDKLIDNNDKSIFLIILVALAFVISFYLSYMVVIFLFIYTIYQLFIKHKELKYYIRILTKLTIHIMIAILLSSFILLPTIIDIKDNLFRYPSHINFLDLDFSRIKMIISKLYIGTIDNDSRFSATEANIYFTLFGLVLFIKYFLNPKISKREKIGSLTLLIIFLTSIIFEFLNLTWHGLSAPNGYNYRFTFLFIFFAICISFKQFLNNYKLNKKQLIIINSIFILISIFMINQYSYLSIIQIISSIIFFISYTILLNKPNKGLILIILIEIIVNLDCSLLTRERLEYTHFHDYQYIKEVCNLTASNSHNQRIALTQINYANDPFTCGTKDVTMTMSTNNKLYFQFMSNIGYSVTYSTLMQNLDIGPFIHSILGVENVIDMEKRSDNVYNLKYVNHVRNRNYYQSFYNYSNNNALALGYIIKNSDINFSNNPFENQNNLAKQMSGLNINIYEPIELTKIKGDKYKFVTDTTSYYFYNYYPIPINQVIYMGVYVNDKPITYLSAFSQGIALAQTTPKITNIMELEIYNHYYDGYINPLLYSLNENNYYRVINALKQQQLNVSYIDKNKLKGSIDLKENGTLMLSIPYEKGWIIKVNNQVTDYKKVYNSFIGLDLNSGTNRIEMYFIPPGFIIGSILTISGVILTIMYRKNKIH